MSGSPVKKTGFPVSLYKTKKLRKNRFYKLKRKQAETEAEKLVRLERKRQNKNRKRSQQTGNRKYATIEKARLNNQKKVYDKLNIKRQNANIIQKNTILLYKLCQISLHIF